MPAVPKSLAMLLLLAAHPLGCGAGPHRADSAKPARASTRPIAGPPVDPARRNQAPAPLAEPAATEEPLPPEDEVEAHHAPESVDDGFDTAPTTGEARPHPLAGLSDAKIADRVRDDITSLGSMSIGRPSGGRLLNDVPMPEGPHWRLVDPGDAWGTRETVDFLVEAITAVAERFPDTPPLPIGHISARGGGPLRPHISHQAGRDVDLGYYYVGDDSWYKRAHEKNLDVERTWALVRAFVVLTDVELILIDHRLQRLLRDHAEKIGEPKAWLDDLFRGTGPRGALIRHARGHATHLHVRFFNPTAQETARRCLPAMIEAGLVEQPVHFVHHRVRKGETLGKLAKRYGTTVRAIQRANGLRGTLIQAKKTYRIPRTGPAPGASEPIRVPARRLPEG